MKLSNLSKLILTAIAIFAFTPTANAEKFILKVCQTAERSFWDTIHKSDNSKDQSFRESLPKEDQQAYLEMDRGNIEKSMVEVRKRCKSVSQDILDTYNKKKSELNKKLNDLSNPAL